MNYLAPAKVLKGAAVFALLLSGSLILAAQKTDSAEISKLFTEIKEHATLAEHDAELRVFSAELRRSEAVALGDPVMPVFDGLIG